MNYYNLKKDSDDFEILKATRDRFFTDNYEFVELVVSKRVEFDIA